MPRKGRSQNEKRKLDAERKRQERTTEAILKKKKVEDTFQIETDEAPFKDIAQNSNVDITNEAISSGPGPFQYGQGNEVVQGSFHQGYHIFSDDTIGRQCSCNSLAGICLLRCIPTPLEIDNALIEGDKLYSVTVDHLKTTGTFNNYYLKVDELLMSFTLGNITFELLKEPPACGLLYGDPANVGQTLHQSIQSLFVDRESGILVLESYMVAVFRSVEGLYVLFDPHSRTIHGEATGKGKSIWMGFSSPDLLAKQIEKLCKSIEDVNFQYELTPITIISGKPQPAKTSHIDNRKPMTRSEKDKYLKRLKYENDPKYREIRKDAAKLKYVADSEHREGKKKACRQKYTTDPQYRESKKETGRQKYTVDLRYRQCKKESQKQKYKTDAQLRENKRRRMKHKYELDIKYQLFVKSALRTKYTEDKTYQTMKKKGDKQRYNQSEVHKNKKKLRSIKLYGENRKKREALKKASIMKYARDKRYRELVKKASITKYARDKKHREKLKNSSIAKYASDEKHREKLKNSSIAKYASDEKHREKVKNASIAKYEDDEKHRETVKRASKRKYAEDMEHQNKAKSLSKSTYLASKRAKENYNHCLNVFRKECSDGPSYACTVCNRLMFRNGVKYYKIENLSKSPNMRSLAKKCAKGNYVHMCTEQCDIHESCPLKQSSYGTEWICHTCDRHLKQGNIPPESEENNLTLCNIPPELSSLNTLERQLISLVIPFMKMVNLPKGGQKGIKGPAVCVPADMSKVQTVFPRHPDEADLIKLKLKRKLSYKGHYNYQKIRLENVKTAMMYLKDYNQFYKDVTFNENWINSVNDELIQEREQSNDDLSESEDEEQGQVEHGVLFETCLQPADPAVEPEALQNAMEYIYNISPCEGNKPVYFSSDPSVEMKSFPYLFPTGRYGYDMKRQKKLTTTKYFNSRIMSADSRFAQDPTYIFFSQYMNEQEHVSSSISIAQRKSTGTGSRKITSAMLTNQKHIQEILSNNTAFRFLQPIRGTPSYWERTLKELFAAVRQLNIPTWFATFSAADFRWPEIITAIALQHGKIIDFNTLDWEEKCELLRLNPVTAARMFDHRVSSFIKEIIKSPANPIGKVLDFFYRVEFQARGSPHIHCLFWVENAPRYGECADDDFISFVDEYTTCRLPDKDDEPELYELVTKVQTHSKNHTKTCKKGNSECRFGFPKPPSKRTFIAKPLHTERSENSDIDDILNEQNEKRRAREKLQQLKEAVKNLENTSLTTEQFLSEVGLTEEAFENFYCTVSKRESIMLKRKANECWINCYNEKLLLAWNGNIDFQPVFDAYSCIMYILSYISKSEKAMSKLLEGARKEAEEENISLRDQMKKLGSAYLTHREVSVQEAVYRVLSMPLKRFTREVIFVPAHPNCTRMTLPLSQIQKKKEDGDDDPFQANIVDKYLARPKNNAFQDLCLADFASQFRVVSGSDFSQSDEENVDADDTFKGSPKFVLQNGMGVIQKRMKSNAVIRFPKFSKTKKSEDHHLVLLKLYLPHYKDEQLKPLGFDTYEDFYEHGSVRLTNSANIQLVKAIVQQNRENYEKNVENIEAAERAYFEAGELEDAWANLAPNTEPARREEEDEAMEAQLLDENEDVLIAEIFDESTSSQTNRKVPKSHSPAQASEINAVYTRKKKHVESQMKLLNEKQQEIFYAVRKWCLLKAYGKHPDPLKLLVHSSGGCGKSFLIDTIYAEACKILEKEDEINQNKVLVTAPTGVAAFNINGLTLHKAFHLPTQLITPYKGLSEDILNQMRCEIGDIQILIIDEISMVGQLMLNYISHRLRQLKQRNAPFGGISVLAFGDFYQLAPVNAASLYSKPRYVDELWKDNFKIVTLTEIMRQKEKGDSEMLCRLRIKKKNEELSDDDFRKLQSRVKPENTPKNALHVFATKKDVAQHNKEMIAATCKQTSILKAVDIVKSKGKVYRKKNCIKTSNDVPEKIEIGVGAKIMLTRNIDVSQGLVNGAFGEVTALLMEEDGETCRVVCVKFNNESVGLHDKVRCRDNPEIPDQSICIYQIEENLQYSNVIRRQFPLKVAFASTIHKVQGLTTDEIVVSLKGIFAAGMSYVALSRVKSLNGLYLLEEVDKKMKSIYCSEEVEKHLESLTPFQFSDNAFTASTSAVLTVAHHNTEGLKSHFLDLQSNAITKYSDVICVTETWLEKEEEFNQILPSYNFIKKARQECSYYTDDIIKGGVGIYLKENLQFEEVLCNSMKAIESLAVFLPSVPIFIMTVYRSPSYLKSEFLKKLEQVLIDIENMTTKTENVMIAGDFNENALSAETKSIMRLFNVYGYRQVIEEPTTLKGTLLDMIFVKANMNCISGVLQSYHSYHEPVFCKLVGQT